MLSTCPLSVVRCRVIVCLVYVVCLVFSVCCVPCVYSLLCVVRSPSAVSGAVAGRSAVPRPQRRYLAEPRGASICVWPDTDRISSDWAASGAIRASARPWLSSTRPQSCVSRCAGAALRLADWVGGHSMNGGVVPMHTSRVHGSTQLDENERILDVEHE